MAMKIEELDWKLCFEESNYRKILLKIQREHSDFGTKYFLEDLESLYRIISKFNNNASEIQLKYRNCTRSELALYVGNLSGYIMAILLNDKFFYKSHTKAMTELQDHIARKNNQLLNLNLKDIRKFEIGVLTKIILLFETLANFWLSKELHNITQPLGAHVRSFETILSPTEEFIKDQSNALDARDQTEEFHEKIGALMVTVDLICAKLE